MIFSLKGKNENPQNQENQENQKNQDNQDNQDNQENQEELKSEELSDKCPEIKEVIGRQSGTTYLDFGDCCKPSCARSEFEGTGKEPRICYTNVTILTEIKAKSVCNGDNGIATTCLSQIPFTINGCENIGFWFCFCSWSRKRYLWKMFFTWIYW